MFRVAQRRVQVKVWRVFSQFAFLRALAAMLAVCLPFSGAQADVVHVAGHDSFPKFFVDPHADGATPIQGVGVDVLKALKRVDPSLEFHLEPTLLPVKRLFKWMETGEQDLFIGISKTADREKFMVYTNQPLYPMRQVAVTRRDAPYQPETLSDFVALGARGEILTFLGAQAIKGYLLTQQPDLRVADRVYNVEEGLQMVEDGFYNFFYFHELAILATMLKSGHHVTLRVLPTAFRESYHYATISRQTPPDLRDKLLRAFDAATDQGAFKRIYDSYKPIR